jgi:hypothetical protein
MRFMLLQNYGAGEPGCAPMPEWSPEEITAYIEFQQALNAELAQSISPPEPAPGRDDTLILMFMCCHPSLTPASAIPLTLRAVGGLTTRISCRRRPHHQSPRTALPDSPSSTSRRRARHGARRKGRPHRPSRHRWRRRLRSISWQSSTLLVAITKVSGRRQSMAGGRAGRRAGIEFQMWRARRGVEQEMAPARLRHLTCRPRSPAGCPRHRRGAGAVTSVPSPRPWAGRPLAARCCPDTPRRD